MKDVIVALDFKEKDILRDFLKQFKEPIYVKVGMELFYKYGPNIVEEIKEMGHKIFLDLKLHDIPHTVKQATLSLLELNIDMINVHISGASEMIMAFVAACQEVNDKIVKIGVTMLTSTTDKTMNEDLRIAGDLEETVLKYAELGKKNGLDGVVCSALEVPRIKEVLGSDFITVTPGIRPLGFSSDDQKRVVTPIEAAHLGSDFIVVGRPITQAKLPLIAYQDIKTQFLGGIKE